MNKNKDIFYSNHQFVCKNKNSTKSEYLLNYMSNLLIQIKINNELIHQFVYKVIDQSTHRSLFPDKHFQN